MIPPPPAPPPPPPAPPPPPPVPTGPPPPPTFSGVALFVDPNRGIHRTRRWPLVAATLGVLFALLAGGAVFVATRPSAPGPVDGQLRYTFPEQPEAAWTLDANDVVPGGRFVASDALAASFDATGVVDLGEVLLTAIDTGSAHQSHMAAIDAADGSVRWVVPVAGSATCATHAIAGTVPCVLTSGRGARASSEIAFIRLDDGTVETSHVNEHAAMVEVADGAVYTIGWEDEAYTVSKGTPADLTAGWHNRFVDTVPCRSSGDAHRLTIRSGMLTFDSATGLAVSTDTGAHLGEGLRSIGSLPGQGYTGTRCSSDDPSEFATVFADPDGVEVFEVRDEGTVDPWLVTSDPTRPVVTGRGAYDPSTGASLWRLPDSSGPDGAGAGGRLQRIVGDVVLGTDDGNRAAYDIRTGDQLWRTSVGGSLGYIRDVSDGERILFATEDMEIVSIHLATGVVEWRTPSFGGDRLDLTPAGDGFAATTPERLSYLPPTGGPAGPPGVLADISGSTLDAVDQDGRLVTRCGREPQMRPVSYRTAAEGLVVSMEITASCPEGDIVSSDALRISISDTGGSIASGIFDFSAEPLLIPRNDGSSPTKSVTREFGFQQDSFWRLPNSIGSTTGETTSTASGDQLVECENVGTDSVSETTAMLPENSTSDRTPLVSSRAAQPVAGDLESTSLDALVAQANADRPFVTADLSDRWIAQISAKRIGLDAPDTDGTPVHWTAEEILRQHLELRLRYPEVRLVRSEEWRTFDLDGWWVSFAGATFDSPDAANNWCDARSIPEDECFAKLVSNSRGSEGTTKYRR